MALVYENLTYEIKQLMLQEVQSDIDNKYVNETDDIITEDSDTFHDDAYEKSIVKVVV